MRVTVVNANAVGVLSAWNMTILPPIRVVEVMMPRIFNCFVLNAIEVNRIAAIVKYITEK
jgi:hypothetical protein